MNDTSRFVSGAGILALATLSSCSFLGGSVKQSAPLSPMESGAVTTMTRIDQPDPVLYGRDGRPVGSSSGNTTRVGAPVHAVEGGEGSRMYLLELYQQAIDEKESLLREVEALNAAQARAQADLERANAETTALRGENGELKAEIERLTSRTLELSSRLTTAQIGRLRSEKLLLEAKIHWEEVQQMMRGANGTSEANSTPGSTPAPSRGIDG